MWLDSRVKSLPLKENEIREVTAAAESALLFQLHGCLRAALQPFGVLSLLLLIVNGFFKCEGRGARVPHLAHSCHIPRCKSEVKPRNWVSAGGVRECCENGGVGGERREH